MANVALRKVRKAYGGFVAVRDVEIEIQSGELVTLLGPSGCGKTTCLRMVAGFVKPDGGVIEIGGQDVTGVPPHRRNTGMVFQSYALFPHKTVEANVAFGLKMRGVARSDIARRTSEVLDLVQMKHLADRYPGQLSGGQRQRVALARAVVVAPEVLLLDEPLGALDLKLREELQVEIKRVQQTLGITTLFVTHDQGEALGMSDRIAVMRDGRIAQIDTPQELYERPNSRYVANFVGKTSLIEVAVVSREGSGAYLVETTAGSPRRLTVSGRQHVALQAGERCSLATRPEHFRLGGDGPNTIPAQIVDVVFRGSAFDLELRGENGEALNAHVHASGRRPEKGEAVVLSWDPEHCFLLKAEG